MVLGNLQLYNEQVEQVNSNPYLLNRVYDWASEKDKFPNFITVDFYDVGDCLEVVDILNEFSETSIKEAKAQNIIFPNPSKGIIHLNFAAKTLLILIPLESKVSTKCTWWTKEVWLATKARFFPTNKGR